MIASAFAAISTTATLAMIGSATSGQDTVVVNVGNTPRWGSAVALIEELRIGSIDGPDEYVFGQPETITVDRLGNITVFDRQVPIIRQYDSLGNYVRDIGRGGDGPGEYRDVRGMPVFDDGRLLVWDISNARATFYDAEGAYLESHPHHILGAPGGRIFFVAGDSGKYHVQIRALNGKPSHPPESYREWPTLMFEVSPTGEAIRSFPVPLGQPTRPTLSLLTNDGRRRSFPDETLTAFSSRGYLVVGYNRTYALNLVCSDGSVRRIVKEQGDAIRLTRGEHAEWEARFRSMERRQQGVTYRGVSTTKPVFRALSVDADGRIWIERYVPAINWDVEPRDSQDGWPARAWREPTTFDVILPEGVFLGTVVLPSHTIAMFRRRMHLWGIQFGEYGEPYVVRFRIEPHES